MNKKNKKGKIATGILLMLIVVVVTSVVIFLLVQQGVIKVKEMEGASALNMEFIPFIREGYLVVKEFKFCSFVDEDYNCVGEKNVFSLGEDVYFRFVIESSIVNGEAMLVENYGVKGPEGMVLLEVDAKNNYYFDLSSKKNRELITFSDYFTAGYDLIPGSYTLDLLIENPLLNKKTTLSKKFILEK